MSAPPILSSASPSDNSSAVAVGSNITLTFNENVFLGTGNLVVSDGYTQSYIDKSGAMQTRWISATDVRTVPAGDAQVTISGNTVTINLSNDLNAGLNYAVYLPRGFLVDANNVPFAGLLDSSKLHFTTAGGIAAPTAHIGATIGFEDSGISNSDYITNSAAQTVHGTYTGTLGVNDSVQVSTDNGVTWHTASTTAGSWTCSSFDALTASSTLVARVVNTQGISSGSVSHSYVFDNTQPTVVSATISDSNLTAGETATVTITFSEQVGNFSILNSTVNSASYGAWTTVDNGLSWSATVTPNVLIQASNVSDQFSVGGTDAAGNGISGSLVTIDSYNIDTTVSVAISALSADSGSDPADFVTNVASQTISGTLGATLPGGAHVQVSLDGGSSWNNAVVSGTSWSYSGATLQPGTNAIQARIIDSNNQPGTPVSHSYILDTSGPAASLAGITPALSGADDIGSSHTDNLTSINTPHIQVTNGGNSNFLAGDQLQIVDTNHGNAVVGQYTITVNDIDGAGGAAFAIENILLSPLSDGEHDLAVRVGDLAGNTPTALSSTLAVTIDTTAPILQSTTPGNNASGVASNTTIVLTFNEAIDASGSLFFTLTDSNDNQQMLGIENGRVSIDGNKVIINLLAPLLTSTAYSLDMNSGAIFDQAGNTAYSSNEHLINFSTTANSDLSVTPHILSATSFAPGSTSFAGQFYSENSDDVVQFLNGASWVNASVGSPSSHIFNWTATTSSPTGELSMRVLDASGAPRQYLDYGNDVIHFGSSGADTINETGDYSIVFSGGGVDTINVGNYAHVNTGVGAATVTAGSHANVVSNGTDIITVGANASVTMHNSGSITASGAGLNLTSDLTTGAHIITIDNLNVSGISTQGATSADKLNLNVSSESFALADLFANEHISGIDILNLQGSGNDITVGNRASLTNFAGTNTMQITADAGVLASTTVHVDHSTWTHAVSSGGFDIYVDILDNSFVLLIQNGITQL